MARLELSQHRALTSLGTRELTKGVSPKLGKDRNGFKVVNRHRVKDKDGLECEDKIVPKTERISSA